MGVSLDHHQPAQAMDSSAAALLSSLPTRRKRRDPSGLPALKTGPNELVLGVKTRDTSWEFLGDFLDFWGISWDFLRFLGISWGFLGFLGISQ